MYYITDKDFNDILLKSALLRYNLRTTKMYSMVHLKSVCFIVCKLYLIKWILSQGVIKDCCDLMSVARIVQRMSRNVEKSQWRGKMKVDTLGRHRR